LAALKQEEAKLFSSSDWLHRSDRVQLVPSVVRVADVGTGDQIALANLRFKIRAVVAAAGFLGVGLPNFALTYRFEDEIAMLS